MLFIGHLDTLATACMVSQGRPSGKLIGPTAGFSVGHDTCIVGERKCVCVVRNAIHPSCAPPIPRATVSVPACDSRRLVWWPGLLKRLARASIGLAASGHR